MQPPGDGALAAGVVIDSSGSLRIIARDEIVAFRRRAGVESALQSYPAILLGDGDVPRQLADTGQGVSLVHRDARLSLGILRDSTVLIALTRFEGLNGVLDVLPFGPTVPEMAALMGALGCTRAVLLDGGISGQLMVRDAKAAHEWPGLRGVPMGIEVVARR